VYDTNNGHHQHQAQDLLDRMLEGKPDAAKARVLNLVYRLKIDANDPLFLVMTAMGYLQTLIEDSPQEWEETFAAFREELNAWTELHLETLETLAKRAESEKNLSEISSKLASLLEKFMISPNEPNSTSATPPPASAESKAISHIPELLEASRSMERQLQRLTTNLPQVLHHLNRSATARVALPGWLAVLLAILSLSSAYNFMTLQTIRDAVQHQPPASSGRR
jgi:thiamine kinase-like enzyme